MDTKHAKVIAMTQIIDIPSKYAMPDYDTSFSSSENKELEKAAAKRLCGFINSVFNQGGSIVRFPFADGYAYYVVANSTILVHLPIGNRYRLPAHEEARLTEQDITQAIEVGLTIDKIYQPSPF